jgi:glycosyltransferase involved in cell wall biosynthesis
MGTLKQSALNNKFVILTTFYNAEDYIGNNLNGTLNQSYRDLGVLFVNDGSSDDSEDILFDKIINTYNGEINQSGSSNIWFGHAAGKDILYIKNSENIDCSALNQKIAVDSYIKNTGTICGIVDGDDFLHDAGAVSWVVSKMGNENLMYASTEKQNDGSNSSKLSNKILTQSDFADIEINGVTYTGMTCPSIRNQGLGFNHFKTFRKILSDNVNTGRSFYGPTGLIKPASDVAFFKPMMEMAGADRIHVSQACHYSRNYENPQSNHLTRLEEKTRNVNFCTYSISGVNFFNNDLDSKSWCDAQGWDHNYITGTAVNFSGIKDNQSGFYIWDPDCHNSDNSITCCTPYNLLSL